MRSWLLCFCLLAALVVHATAAAEWKPGTLRRGPDGKIVLVPPTEGGAAPAALPARQWRPSSLELAGGRADAARPGALEVEPATPSALALRWPVAGDHNGNAHIEVAYRRRGADAWQAARPLFWIDPGSAAAAEAWRREDGAETKSPVGRVPGGRLFAGSIVGLAPDTAYDVRLELIDPDGGSATKALELRTTAEPRAPTGMRLRHVVAAADGGGTGTKNDPFLGLAPALRDARPGDLLLLAPGTYRGGPLRPARSGTAGQPIILRGDGPVVLDGGDGTTLIDVAGRRHIWIEGLTLKGAQVLIQARGASHIVARGNRFLIAGRKLAAGFEARGAGHRDSQGFFITDNVFIGPNDWPRARKAKSLGEFIFGVAITGAGHVIGHNLIRNVGDGINNGGGGFLSASDIHHNEIFDASDDCIEADHAASNLRVFRNRLTNCFVAVSAQPVHGGPAYIYRNLIFNTQSTPFKLHNETSGLLIFHNTSVRAGIPFNIQPGGETVSDVITRNNLFIGTGGPALRSTGVMVRSDFDNDGYAWPGGDFALWNGRRYRSPAASRAAGGPYAGSGVVVLGTTGEFARRTVPPADDTRRQDPQTFDPRLATGSRALDRGVALANFNDDFRGAAPDLGCCELGEALPRFGPRAEFSLR